MWDDISPSVWLTFLMLDFTCLVTSLNYALSPQKLLKPSELLNSHDRVKLTDHEIPITIFHR